MGAWNTSEMGRVISEFREKYGETDSVWIVPYPYWVDTRLPGVWAGIPTGILRSGLKIFRDVSSAWPEDDHLPCRTIWKLRKLLNNSTRMAS